ncbi:MAG: translation initiation factor IF-2 [Bacteroidia bacterium]|nr:translation initiation factor IF-2 [Bacteroidia bacterium]
MSEVKRLSRVAKECNVGIQTIVDFLHKKGFDIENNPNAKIPPEALVMVMKEYQNDLAAKREAVQFKEEHKYESRTTISIEDTTTQPVDEEPEQEEVLLIQDSRGSSVFDLDQDDSRHEKRVKKEAPEVTSVPIDKPVGPKIVGRVELEKPKPKIRPKPIPQPAVTPEPGDVHKPEPKLATLPDKDDGPKTEHKPRQKAEHKPVPESQEPLSVVADQEPEPVTKPSELTGAGPKSVEPIIGPVQDEPPQPQTRKVAEEEVITRTTLAKDLLGDFKVVGRIDIDSLNQKTRPSKKYVKEKPHPKPVKETKEIRPAPTTVLKQDPKPARQVDRPRKEQESDAPIHRIVVKKASGPTIVGKIALAPESDRRREKVVVDLGGDDPLKKKKRKRIRKDRVAVVGPAADREAAKVIKKPTKVRKKIGKVEISEEDVQRQIKDTLSRITPKGKSKGSKHRKSKRELNRQSLLADADRDEQESHVIKVTEFVTANELASLMNVQVNEIISTCMSLGLFVSINQRLDAETISVVADEFGFDVQFISVEIQEAIEQELDKEADLKPRPPVVTVMGHVDHGKTSLLDYIRKTNIIAGEAGGITQHIGAYKVVLDNGKTITFLDTPGHEAFTAMRARGAQGADMAVIVIAADDAVMPQTIEAINHAAAAGVPMVFAINKIDREGANPEKIKEQLAGMNYLVEDWGGKYQSQEISAKKGMGVAELLEKILLESEMLDLKANPEKNALGTVIESSLDKGRGFVTTILVQGGTLKVGDIVLAGSYFGKVKAMFNERGGVITIAGPSEPVLILGLNGAPQAGDKFHVLATDREARDIATKREQLQREQELRTRKHITLDEIGRRIAIGNFQELNIIVKGDVDGSIEALSDSLIKLSTPEIQVNIIHKAVGQISESDILLATASNAIIIGFQVRPSLNARKLAEKEGIEIRLYSIIYDAINELRAAMEGMLSPEIKEEITGTLEVMEAFKITKVGTVAGCIVRDGKIYRTSKVRIIRDGIVVYDGLLGSLKRFKDDAKEVVSGLECGLNIDNYNNIEVGDNIEAYTSREVKKTL